MLIGTIERAENLLAIFRANARPSSSTVMVMPSLSTAKPTSISYWNNAGHYEQCFPAHFPELRVAIQRPRPRREVNRQRLAICSASNAALSSTSLHNWLALWSHSPARFSADYVTSPTDRYHAVQTLRFGFNTLQFLAFTLRRRSNAVPSCRRVSGVRSSERYQKADAAERSSCAPAR